MQQDWCPYMKGNIGCRDTHGGRSEEEGRDQGDAPTSQEIPQIACKPPEAVKKSGIDSPSQPQKEPTLPTAPFQTSSLQNCETTIFLL